MPIKYKEPLSKEAIGHLVPRYNNGSDCPAIATRSFNEARDICPMPIEYKEPLSKEAMGHLVPRYKI